MRDVVVIGAGLAGLTAVLCLAHGGVEVALITKGIGGFQLPQGTVDFLGCSDSGRTAQPLAEVETHIASRPEYPYPHFMPEFIVEPTNWPKEVLGPKLLVGDPRQNVIIPAPLGALRPTSLYQPSMVASIPAMGKSYVIVGLKRLKDFYPKITTENLSRQATVDGVPIQMCSLIVDIEIRRDETDTTGMSHARALDNAAMRERLVAATALHLKEREVVGLPAVLGLNDLDAWKDIEKCLGHRAFEIVIQPSSIPGTRLNQELIALVKVQTRFIIGSHVTGVEIKDGVVAAVSILTTGRPTRIETKNVILAGGGFEPGALDTNSYGTVTDSILGLPIPGAEDQFPHGDFWGCERSVFPAGLDVDGTMHPLDADKKPVYSNVYVAGENLAGATRWRERSSEDIALASVPRVADQILGSLE